jgi:hypothetical protein
MQRLHKNRMEMKRGKVSEHISVLVTQWLVHVSLISVTEVLVTQWLLHVSFISVTVGGTGAL